MLTAQTTAPLPGVFVGKGKTPWFENRGETDPGGPGPRFNWMRLCGAVSRNGARTTDGGDDEGGRASEAARRRGGGAAAVCFAHLKRAKPLLHEERESERGISQSRRYCYVALTRISV